jgi:magnesium transporter
VRTYAVRREIGVPQCGEIARVAVQTVPMPPVPSPKIRTRAWHDGELAAHDFPLAEVSDHLGRPGGLAWADLRAPDEATLAQLAAQFGFDPHAIEDALGTNERPKAMRYAGHLFLTTTAIVAGPGGQLSSARVSAFVLERGLITVRLDDTFDIDAVVRRWEDNAGLLEHGPAALVHGLLDVIVDGYFDSIESLDDQIEQIEDALFDENQKAAKDVQRKTFALRKCLVLTRRAVLPMREVVSTVMRGPTGDGQSTALVSYYTDLYDHTLRAAEWTESLRDMITSIFETNMSLSDTRMNLIMKKLTSWAAIIAVPTAVTGYYGQNVPFPGSGEWWGYLLSIGLIVVLAVILYIVFRRKDWL